MINVYQLSDAVPAALFGMFALWAAGSRRHWFVRMAVVSAALLVMLLIPAYDLVLKFGAEVLFLVFGLALWRWWQRRQAVANSSVVPGRTPFRPQVSLATLMLLMVVVAVVTTVASRAPNVAIYEWVECFGIGVMTAATGLACVWIVCGQTRWWFRLLAFGPLVFGLAVATRWMWAGRWMLQHWITSPNNVTRYWQGIMHDGVFGGAEYWMATVSIGMAILCVWLFLMVQAGWFDPFREADGQSIRQQDQVRGTTAARWAASGLFVVASLFPLLLLYRLMTPTPIPDLSAPRPNGYDDLVAAGRIIGGSDADRVWQLRYLSKPQLREIVARSRAAYARVGAALKLDCRFPFIGGANRNNPIPIDERRALYGLRDVLVARWMLATKSGATEETITAILDMLHLERLEKRSSGLDPYDQYGIFLAWGAKDELWSACIAMSADQCAEVARHLFDLDRLRVPWETRVEHERIIKENSGWERHLRSILDEWAGTDRYESERYADTVDQIEYRMLIVGLAVRAFELRTGRLPAKLDELVPDYLPAIPADPYDEDQPLRYRASGEDYVLYSIGPNRIDDDGVPRPSAPNGAEGDITSTLRFPLSVTKPAAAGNGQSDASTGEAGNGEDQEGSGSEPGA